MNKSLIAFSVVFVLMVMIVSTGLVLADSDESGSDNSGSDESKVEGSSRVKIDADYDKDGTKIVTKTITEVKDGREVKRKIVTKIKDGVVLREMKMEKKRFIDSEGKESEVSLEVVGGKFFRANGGVQAKSDLEISENDTDGKTKVRVQLKDGSYKEIKVLPDRASEIAKARLRMKFGNDSLEIREIKHKNVPRVVYHLQGNSTGRFLGIFKTHVNANSDVDAETGEVLVVHRPWWAFLVTGKNNVDTETETPVVNNEMPVIGSNESEMEVVNETNVSG